MPDRIIVNYDQAVFLIEDAHSNNEKVQKYPYGRLKTRLMQGLSNMENGGQKSDLQLKDHGPHLEPLLYKTVIITFSSE
jgi:hypothetical protein